MARRERGVTWPATRTRSLSDAAKEALNRRAAERRTPDASPLRLTSRRNYFAAAFSFAASSFARAVTYARTASISDWLSTDANGTMPCDFSAPS